MHTAFGVLQRAGVDVGPLPRDSDPAAAHLARAVFWQSYNRGPAPAAHRACGADIARGSMRLWAAAGGVPMALARRRSGSRSEVALARVQLAARARRICSRLRADLGRESAAVSPWGSAVFVERVRAATIRAAGELDDAVTRRLAGLGSPAQAPGPWEIPVEDCLPPWRGCALENRLTTLLGAGFGVGVAVSVDRLALRLKPEVAPVAAVLCGLLGLALTWWVVRTRRLLSERAAAERWLAEVLANLRLAMEERVLSRMTSADTAPVVGSGRPRGKAN